MQFWQEEFDRLTEDNLYCVLPLATELEERDSS
jgi:hypothetical protein